MEALQKVMRVGDMEEGLRDFCHFMNENLAHNSSNSLTIVEIGSYAGESAEIFAQEFPNAKIYCIDPWEGNYDKDDSCSEANYLEVEEQFDLRLKDYNIVKLKGYSVDFFQKCDIVYIDGRHFYEGVKEDILHWMPLTKQAICGHDYYEDEEFIKIHPHIKGVRQAVDEIFKSPDKVFKDGSWVKLL